MTFTSDLNYDSFVTRLANTIIASTSDPNFLTMLRDNIVYAEQRIYRDLDLIHTQVTDATAQLSSGDRNFTLPTAFGTFITVDQMNVVSPAATRSSVGTRVPLLPVSCDYLDMVYPSNRAQLGLPQYYGRRSDNLVIVGPPPDGAYYVEVIGEQRPQALSSANSSTVLTQYVPDLFMAASYVHAFGYQRDYGATTDNPQAAVTWEQTYQTLLKSASVEQFRAQFRSEGWTSLAPSPIATPPRV